MEVKKEELKPLLIPVIIILIVYGFIMWLIPHTDLYKEKHKEINYYQDLRSFGEESFK